MPSGAKKRKAAKKKKEKETTNNLQGIDESKVQDDKGSDGGSPAYCDHDDDHQQPFKEGNEEAAEVVEANLSAALPSAEVVPTRDVMIDETVGRKDEFGFVTETELKAEEERVIGDGNDEEAKSTKELDYEKGGSSSNGEAASEKNLRDDRDSSIKETVKYDELVESIDSSHAKMTSMAEDAPACVADNSVVESSICSDKAAGALSEVKSSGNGNALQEKLVVSQVGATEFGMKRKEDNRTSTFEEPKPKEFNNEVLLSPAVSIPLPKSTNETDVRDSETPECSENQPLAASAPRMVQKTSWLNCCGLFEVLSGTER
ncbi:hypothetical protein HN51_012258 [Arachis hypogaea]|uniref:Uncharacterized protein n=1 Tax=Arachis hypogaea TaxID=3818 RepID=A0A445DVE9_ARAHY|nr:uncharacterized protein LOC112790661 [Arachis hypogaea]XP_025688960.1 uncharacterized protein LOC112790661 [Arachis hypogaea]QHO57719.1 uncharacterized protein DS421_3g84650 [Arachis hypogaea]QHO57720.1 uncharacterized protein DS421_3g84650 [Arachis hypogaea]RYR67163.1 hypothetical protein Ahy_A03g013449 isoform A [Arachis hypogaea]RYR67164.1 hypothetical protein Ahy_A03g013449 isoform B [Arachis hypogaea]